MDDKEKLESISAIIEDVLALVESEEDDWRHSSIPLGKEDVLRLLDDIKAIILRDEDR